MAQIMFDRYPWPEAAMLVPRRAADLEGCALRIEKLAYLLRHVSFGEDEGRALYRCQELRDCALDILTRRRRRLAWMILWADMDEVFGYLEAWIHFSAGLHERERLRRCAEAQ